MITLSWILNSKKVMKRLIYFFSIPFLLIGCGTSPGKVGTIDDDNYTPVPLSVQCNTGKIKVASLEDLSGYKQKFLESISKGISTRFVNPKEYNEFIKEEMDLSQSDIDDIVFFACDE